jgi:hypothetical protein
MAAAVPEEGGARACLHGVNFGRFAPLLLVISGIVAGHTSTY